MTEAALVEGQVKLRDGKKWKSRWLVLRKPSPVADCLLMLAYKDKSDRAKGVRERSSLALEDICGLEPGLPYEGLAHTLAIICLSQAVMLGFDSREALWAWDARIRYALGEVHRFHVTVAPGTKLESGPATLHLCNGLLVLARDVPPAVAGQWRLADLRRYGAVPHGFIFEGGTRCGYWAGVFFLSSTEGEQISFLFDCIVRGISPTKGPFGLRPVLPGSRCLAPGAHDTRSRFPRARGSTRGDAHLREHPGQPLLPAAAALPGTGTPGGGPRGERGRRLLVCPDRHRGHGDGAPRGGPARTDPGGAAAGAGAAEEGHPPLTPGRAGPPVTPRARRRHRAQAHTAAAGPGRPRASPRSSGPRTWRLGVRQLPAPHAAPRRRPGPGAARGPTALPSRRRPEDSLSRHRVPRPGPPRL
ncbi:protein Dok-7 isoform X3 [Perognathus longimembris pacificus]|uniref:protein Dok-7 isoform X3 n=1 Tax=Perognathus longimembris pacificus TaxID=214514 RepID=UPI002018CC88|nr:protein Dok-7 isoform X3 [Perognathus longimembris pacificus]